MMDIQKYPLVHVVQPPTPVMALDIASLKKSVTKVKPEMKLPPPDSRDSHYCRFVLFCFLYFSDRAI